MDPKIRLLVLLGVITLLVSLAACSFSTDYVVVNESNDRVLVRYVIKKPAAGFRPVGLFETPSIKTVSELEKAVAWRHLPDSQWTFNAETRTAVITLLPQEVLRVERESGVFCGEDKPEVREDFYIEEITITGSKGAIRLTGEQVRKGFARGTKQRCDLTYR